MHVLLDDDQGRLTLRRLRPWHRMLARSRAARLDRELADGMSPEASASLAARAIRLTSKEFRRDLATSLQRILAAAGEASAVMPSRAAAGLPRADGDPTPGPRARLDARHPAGTPDWSGDGQARPVTARLSLGVTRPPHVPLRLERVSRSAPLLAALAGRLVEPGPVPVRGVAMVSQLLADGTGPLYREACADDLGAVIEQAARALAP